MDIREKIIEGASVQFRIYGVKAVTMDSLAAHLGISKRTIYESFTDKDELLIEVLTDMAQKHKRILQETIDNSENAIIAIFRLMEVNRDFFHSMSPVFQADLKKFHMEALMKRSDNCEMPDFRNTIKVFENGKKEKLFRKDINPDIVNRCFYGLGKMSMNNELFPPNEFGIQDILDNIFINYLRGISTPEGKELINNLEKKHRNKSTGKA
jgi:AcrR family transcriptional regulator